MTTAELAAAGRLSPSGNLDEPPIGSEQSFWAHDFTTDTSYAISATLTAKSSTAYLFVEKGKTVNSATLSDLSTAFDSMVPGMHTAFGMEEDIDSDPIITILLLDIRDGYNPSTSTSFVAGYFNAIDEMADHTYSNKREMFYIDINPANPASDDTKGVLAHEFQHMIHFKADPNEDLWFNEGLSDLATKLMGYGHSMGHVNDFVAAPDKDLTVWDGDLKDYGASYMFMLYLYEQFPSKTVIPLSHILVAGQQHGIAGVNDALVTAGYPLDNFGSVFYNWTIALGLNNRSVNRKWGYQDLTYNIHTSSHTYWFSPVDIGGSNAPSPLSRHANDYLQLRFLNPLDYARTFEANFAGDAAGNFSFYEVQNNQVTQAAMYSSDKARGGVTFVPGLLGAARFGVGRGDDISATGNYTITVKPLHNIVFVIDDTGSMTDDIASVKQTVTEKITELSANNSDLLYTLISFKDYVTYRGSTSDPEVMKSMVNALYAAGGDDCPEAAFEALDEAAARVSGGDVWLMTDADAHGGLTKALDTAARLVKAGLKAHIVSLGSCYLARTDGSAVCSSENDPSANPVVPEALPGVTDAITYMQVVSDKTGGHYFAVSSYEVGSVLETSLQEMVSDSYIYWSPEIAASPAEDDPITISVDQSTTRIGFLANSYFGSNTLKITRPDGSVITEGDPGITHIITTSSDYYSIDAPTAGEWVIYVIGDGAVKLSVSAHTDITLAYIGNPSLAFQKPSRIKAYLPGEFTGLTFFLSDATGGKFDIELFDDGLHSDGQSGDGIYAGDFTPDQLTTYHLGVVGSSATVPVFERNSPMELRVQTVDVRSSPIQYVLPGAVVTHTLEIANLGVMTDTYGVSATSTTGWSDLGSLPYFIELAPHSVVSYTVHTTVPAAAMQGTSDLITVVANSLTDPQISDLETFGVVSDPENLAAPVIESLEPESVPVGSRTFTLTLHGENFIGDSQVYWEDVALNTTIVSDTLLTAIVPEALLENIGQFSITVENSSFGTKTLAPALFTVTDAHLFLPLINMPD